MSKAHLSQEKGIALFMVLGMLLVVTALATVILNIITSQTRITAHQTERIRAYYAAQAGINLAMENLRTGDWQPPQNYCINCTVGPPANRVNDAAIPYIVMINIGNLGQDPDGPLGPNPAMPNSVPIEVTVTY